MADVVLDANVLVGALDENDSLHVRATALVNRFLDDGHATVLLDFLIAEAISVIVSEQYLGHDVEQNTIGLLEQPALLENFLPGLVLSTRQASRRYQPK